MAATPKPYVAAHLPPPPARVACRPQRGSWRWPWSQQVILLNSERLMWRRAPSKARDSHYSFEGKQWSRFKKKKQGNKFHLNVCKIKMCHKFQIHRLFGCESEGLTSQMFVVFTKKRFEILTVTPLTLKWSDVRFQPWRDLLMMEDEASTSAEWSIHHHPFRRAGSYHFF